MSGQPLLYVALGVFATLFLTAIVLRVRRYRRSRVAVRRARRAVDGELAAKLLLEQRGFVVVGQQVCGTWSPQLDGVPVVVELRADYLVTRGGRQYVAEVKTGDYAPELRLAATRRQLLEYRLALPVDGVLLVVPERGVIHEIVFPFEHTDAAGRRLGAALAGLIVGAALTGAFCLAATW